MSTLKNLVKQVLTEKENRRYEKQLAKRRVSYDRWVKEQEKLSCHAEKLIYEYFVTHPEVQIAYGDEDVYRDGERSNPWYKPDWSPDLFDCWYYFGSVVIVRRELMEKCPCTVEAIPLQQGTLFLAKAEKINDEQEQEAFVGWVRSCLELAGGWQRGCKAIGHIPAILHHCESVEQQMRYRQWKTGAVERNSSIRGKNVAGNENTSEDLISIIIPSKDNPEILKQCVDKIAEKEKKLNYELIIVDNGSSEDNRKKIEELLCGFKEECVGENGKALRTVKYIYQPMTFNFSKMCNLGAESSSGNLLLFLNDDVELCQENSLCELAKLAVREYIGAVGLKLYYPNSDRIQHAGITNLPMGPVHKLQFLKDDRDYYFGTNRGLRNVLAVTAACLMVERKKFLEVRGFAEDLQVAFNDVDFCFKLYEQGYYNVCNNGRYAYHHESLSRGDDESTEKWLRLLKERETLYAKHPKLEREDPYYGDGLGREGLDTCVRCKYETAGNEPQRLWVSKQADLVNCRQDNCLLLRVENCTGGVLQGYGVVLGDDNACYEKKLVLALLSDGEENKQTESYIPEKEADLPVYEIFVEGQYRPDLVENMPDQRNVGLSGFWLELSNAKGSAVEKQNCLPCGSYRIGMVARNRVTGLKLMNWSSRILKIE